MSTWRFHLLLNHKFPELTLNQSCCFDLTRFFAAQMVVIGHLFAFMNIIIIPDFALGVTIQIQDLGVVIFFVLSGYLISYSLFRNLLNKRYTFADFFKDRFYRIYVTLIPCLCFIALMDSFMPNYQYAGAFNLKTFIGNLFMLQDCSFSFARYAQWDSIKNLLIPLQITSFGSARQLWTLAIEWWLYLAFGWFILNVLPKQKPLKKNLGPLFWRNSLQLIVFWFLLIIPVYNLLGRGNGLTLTWLAGSILFFAVYYQKIRLQVTGFWFVIGSSTCLYLLHFIYFNLGSFYDLRISILIAVLFGLLLAVTHQIKVPASKLLIRLIRFAGGYSYALYLVHYTIMRFFVNSYGVIEHKFFVTLAAFLVSNLVACIFYILFDKQYKKLREVSIDQKRETYSAYTQ